MPKLIIDNIPVEVPEGTTVLEAARAVEIRIPHFCWHPALGRAGACRVCAVKLLEGPVKGIQMSCMLPAQDGMVVSTGDPEAVELRKSVVEWLMINHPHDCPVCDEGGECQLQDLTIACGHGLRRYDGRKRTHTNQDLGPQIAHEMNRCIQCYRCARFYQEYAGGTDFGVMGSAGRVYFGRFRDGAPESPFSGNLVDICPTGVFTDKTARFKARYWDYQMAPSICQSCSLGCATTPAAHYRELHKIMARCNEVVNGWFICDRGRFGATAAVNAPERPRQALVDGQAVSGDEALDAVLLRLGEIAELYGPDSIAVVASGRLALEAGALLPLLALTVSAGALCYFCDRAEAEHAAALTGLASDSNSASQGDLRTADLIALTGMHADDAPMLLLAVRQAWRNGAQVFVVGEAGPLPFAYNTADSLASVPFSDAARPVLVCGEGADVAVVEALLERHAALRFAPLFRLANSYGAALLSREHGATSLEEALADGAIRGIVAVEADIPAHLLAGIPFVAALDWQDTAAVRAAQVVLPTTAWVEMDGTCINNEGRAQRFRQVLKPGLPVRGLDPSGHPPHLHRSSPPGGSALPAWQVVAELIGLLGGERITEPLSGRWQPLRGLDAAGEGVRIHGR